MHCTRKAASFILELTETDDAYIVEVDGATSEKSGAPAPSSRLFGNNDLVNGLVFGAGAGVVGSLVVGALLDQKNKQNNCRYKRDGTSAR